MIETRHRSIESNPVPTSIFEFYCHIIAQLGAKMDVGTGLDSRPCLVSIIFADLTSLHPPSFDFYTCCTNFEAKLFTARAPLREPYLCACVI